MRYKLLVSAGYVALMGSWVYVVADRGLNAPESILALMLGGAQLALGVAIGWRALLLPPLVVLIAVPAGVSDAYPSAELAIWFGTLIALGPACLLIVMGAIARTIYEAR